MLTLKDVTVKFERNHLETLAVDHVSLEVNKGDTYGIIGYSGAGKSTLVRTINLLARPTSGQIFFHDEDITKITKKELRQVRQKMGMIFQHFNLLNSRTVFDNVYFSLRHTKLSKKERIEKTKNLLEMVGLSEKLTQYPKQLSGGQKQRVAIARALANDPEILLCDEATSALDPKTTESILKLLKELNHRLGLTIVIITHEMSVVKEICNHVAIMNQGKVIEKGSIVDLFINPKEQITKDFIHTADNLNQGIELVKNHPIFIDERENATVVLLSYNGEIANESLISKIFQLFNVEINILYGNVEVLQNTPLGRLIVSIKGEPLSVKEAISYLKKSNVQISLVHQSSKSPNIEQLLR